MRCKRRAGVAIAPPLGRPLTLVPVGQRVHLVTVQAGCGLQGHLLAMGLIPGIEVEVIHKAPADHGPILVRIGNSRLALGWCMAQKIYVE
ncbi:FeoA family protein [Desulfobacca acetoxidans]